LLLLPVRSHDKTDVAAPAPAWRTWSCNCHGHASSDGAVWARFSFRPAGLEQGIQSVHHVAKETNSDATFGFNEILTQRIRCDCPNTVSVCGLEIPHWFFLFSSYAYSGALRRFLLATDTMSITRCQLKVLHGGALASVLAVPIPAFRLALFMYVYAPLVLNTLAADSGRPDPLFCRPNVLSARARRCCAETSNGEDRSAFLPPKSSSGNTYRQVQESV
jgi:hypothetical protein